jgi:AsmA protein
VDQTTGVKKQISDFNLDLSNLSLDKPVGVKLSARLDEKPISLEGVVGPVGKVPGRQDLNFDMTLNALEELRIHFKGKVATPASAPGIAMDLAIEPFSPRKVMAAMNQSFPVETADPTVLDRVSLKTRIEGNANAISLTNGMLGLDDSHLTFLADVKAFDKPDIRFDLALDRIDLDRYLPPKQANDNNQPTVQTPGDTTAGQQKKTDYTPLRKLLLDGKMQVGNLTAAKVKIQDFLARITAKNGIINLDPLSVNLYQGSVASTARLDVTGKTPETRITLDAKGIQSGPLLKDALEREIIEGKLSANMTLGMAGESPDRIKKSLAGKGELKFVDGAIVGIDIANAVRNAAAGVGLGKTAAEKPRTDFAELIIPFAADQGIVNIPGASLSSPLVRLSATGNANLVTETLDFRVEPKVVATLKGQGDTQERSGLMVPLLVTGSFASPKIRPDVKAMIGGKIPDAEGIKQLLNTKGAQGSDGASVEDKAKEMLKGFVPNLKN